MVFCKNEFNKTLSRLRDNDPNLTRLQFGFADVDDAEVKALAEALRGNTNVTQLRLRGNNITDDGAIALAQSLLKNDSLITLILGRNRISGVGAFHFIEVIKKHPNLTVFSVDCNKISDHIILMLVEAFKDNEFVLDITVEQNKEPVEVLLYSFSSSRERQCYLRERQNDLKDISDKLTTILTRNRTNFDGRCKKILQLGNRLEGLNSTSFNLEDVLKTVGLTVRDMHMTTVQLKSGYLTEFAKDNLNKINQIFERINYFAITKAFNDINYHMPSVLLGLISGYVSNVFEAPPTSISCLAETSVQKAEECSETTAVTGASTVSTPWVERIRDNSEAESQSKST